MLRRSAALARCARPTATLSQQQASSTPAAAAAARPFSTQTSKNHETWRGDNDDDALPKVKRRDGSVEVIGNVRGFVDYERNPEPYRAPMERVTDWEEINSEGHDPVERIVQAARCMDCGTPFCQTHTGCPVNNLIPEFNALVYQDQWRNALDRLHQTNNFPEFTGRVCPAPCEGACVAGLIDSPVTIKNMEYAIVERGFAEGWIQARIPETRTGLSVAVVGSGPAGLACADVLNQQGHKVTVYEREDRPGGLLMYGIPNMKLDKGKVERRINLLEEEGIEFVCNAEIGKNVNVETIRNANDALVLCTGATIPRDLPVPNRDAKGIHFAMEFLTKNQKRLMMTRDGTLESEWGEHITAEGKDVIVIGGGDTGTDCIGTSMRHRCKSIVNFELMGRPPDARADSNPWPEWPKVYGVDYGHGEVQAVFGQDPREYGVITTEFLVDDDNNVKGLRTSDAKLGPSGVEIVPDSEREWPCDLVLLAMGFVSPEHDISSQLSLALDPRENIRATYGEYATSMDGVFAAGDCRRGQSLVVWAINEGRGAALKCDAYLQNLQKATASK